MDLEDNAMGLTPGQTDKILQFQDLTGIEDMSICRDVLQRHQWDLEVSIIVIGVILVIDHKDVFFGYFIRCFK